MTYLNSYMPTEGLTDRNIDTYYKAIKEMLTGLNSNGLLIRITADDSSRTLTVTSAEENLNSFNIKIIVNSTQVVINTNVYSATNTRAVTSFTHNNFANDIIFYIYESNSEFTVGTQTMPFCFGIFTATSFSQNKEQKKIVIINCGDSGSSYYGTYICTNNPSYRTRLTSAFYRTSYGLSSTYRFLQYPVSGTSLLADHIYFADGGMSNPPSRFSVGDDEYLTLYPVYTNLCFKLGSYENGDDNDEQNNYNNLLERLNSALENTLNGVNIE